MINPLSDVDLSNTSSGITISGLEPLILRISKLSKLAILLGNDFNLVLFGKDRNIKLFKSPISSGSSLTTPLKFNASKSLNLETLLGSFKSKGSIASPR